MGDFIASSHALPFQLAEVVQAAGYDMSLSYPPLPENLAEVVQAAGYNVSLSYPPPPEKLAEVVQAAGYDVMEMGYIQRETVNHKEGLCVRRIFLQGKFLKPKSTEDQGKFLKPRSTQKCSEQDSNSSVVSCTT